MNFQVKNQEQILNNNKNYSVGSLYNKRSKLDTFCEILLEISKNENQLMRSSEIIRKCNLTWLTFKSYIEYLLIKQLIEIIPVKGYNKIAYHITKEGLLLAYSYQKIREKI